MQTNKNLASFSNSDEKGFTLIRTDIIQLWVWLEGSTPLDDQPLKSLSEDISYRIRETLDSAVNYMRHCKRSKLKTSDLNKAFQFCNIEKTYGYLSQQPFEYNIIKGTESRDKVLQNCYKTHLYELKDKKVQLKLPDDEENELKDEKNFANLHSSKTLHAKWWIVNNSLKHDYNDATKNELEETINTEQDVESEFIIAPLNDDYNKFYETITSVILMRYESQENDDELFETVLNTLRTNLKLQPILPHLVSFISQTIQKLTSNCTAKTTATNLFYLQRCIDVLKHLIMNRNVFLAPKGFFSKIISCLLFCILQNLKIVSTPDGLGLRESCSLVLILFMRLYQRFSIETINYMTKNFFLPRLNEKIQSDSQLFSVYGVLSIIKNFGGQMIDEFYKVLIRVATKLNEEDLKSYQLKFLVLKTILRCFVSYYNWLVKKHATSKEDESFSIEKLSSVYKHVYDLFGDSFLNQIRLKNRLTRNVDKKSANLQHEGFLGLSNLKKIKFRPLAYISNKHTENLQDLFEDYHMVGKSKSSHIVISYGKQIKTEKNKQDSHQVNYNFCDKLFTNLVLLRKYSN